MVIREATVRDLDELVEMENLFKNPFTKIQVLYEILKNPTSKFLVACDDKKPSLIFGFIDFWITFDSATICQLAVKKEYQNMGIASKLLEESFKILKENKVLFYTLEVREHNEKAINLYKKHGFTYVTLKEQYYSDGENAIYMMKGIL